MPWQLWHEEEEEALLLRESQRERSSFLFYFSSRKSSRRSEKMMGNTKNEKRVAAFVASLPCNLGVYGRRNYRSPKPSWWDTPTKSSLTTWEIDMLPPSSSSSSSSSSSVVLLEKEKEECCRVVQSLVVAVSRRGAFFDTLRLNVTTGSYTEVYLDLDATCIRLFSTEDGKLDLMPFLGGIHVLGPHQRTSIEYTGAGGGICSVTSAEMDDPSVNVWGPFHQILLSARKVRGCPQVSYFQNFLGGQCQGLLVTTTTRLSLVSLSIGGDDCHPAAGSATMDPAEHFQLSSEASMNSWTGLPPCRAPPNVDGGPFSYFVPMGHKISLISLDLGKSELSLTLESGGVVGCCDVEVHAVYENNVTCMDGKVGVRHYMENAKSGGSEVNEIRLTLSQLDLAT
jgi:hypothetical protein